MKKVFAVLMCVVILCMTMCITAFAAETESDLVPSGAEIVQDGQKLENGKTYYIVYVPYGAYTGAGYNSISVISTSYGSYSNCPAMFHLVQSVSHAVGWYGESDGMNSKMYLIDYRDTKWDESCFVFPDVPANEIVRGEYYTVQFNVPDDGKQYYLDYLNEETYTAFIYTYTPCEHVYSNACDTHCDKCNYERSITHTYINDNDHNCSVCGFTNTNPTHVYDGDKDYTCNYCDYKRPQPRVWENLTGLSAFVIAIVVELATAITKSPLMLLAIVGIPCVGLGAGILRRLFSQRV